jgi:hypothetical protein
VLVVLEHLDKVLQAVLVHLERLMGQVVEAVQGL